MSTSKIAGLGAVAVALLGLRVLLDEDMDSAGLPGFAAVVFAAFVFIAWNERRMKNRARPPKPHRPFVKRKGLPPMPRS